MFQSLIERVGEINTPKSYAVEQNSFNYQQINLKGS